MADGFIVIGKKIRNWKWWKNPTARAIWVYILMEANWKDEYDKHGNLIERGSFIRSLRSMEEECGYTVKTIRAWLKRFEDSGEIKVEKVSGYTKILVINYRKYQDYKPDEKKKSVVIETTPSTTVGTTPSTTVGTTPSTTDRTIYNLRNNSNLRNNITAQSDKNHSEPTADVDPIPLVDGTEFFPTVSDFEQWVRAYPAVDVRTEISKMRAWCLANPKNRKTRNGAQRFIVNWLSKSQNSAPRLKEIPKEIVPDYITKQLEDEKKEEEHLW